MKAVVWHDVGKLSVDEVSDPVICDSADAIVRITASAICGTDLHFVRGSMPGMQPGTILGHDRVPGLLSKIASGAANPSAVWTQREAMPTVTDAYEAFDRREPGWTKVIIETGG